jgi:hypothetical protein
MIEIPMDVSMVRELLTAFTRGEVRKRGFTRIVLARAYGGLRIQTPTACNREKFPSGVVYWTRF